jgi:hypothetical protein
MKLRMKSTLPDFAMAKPMRPLGNRLFPTEPAMETSYRAASVRLMGTL